MAFQIPVAIRRAWNMLMAVSTNSGSSLWVSCMIRLGSHICHICHGLWTPIAIIIIAIVIMLTMIIVRMTIFKTTKMKMK